LLLVHESSIFDTFVQTFFEHMSFVPRQFLSALGARISGSLQELAHDPHSAVLQQVLLQAKALNPWFTEEQVLRALQHWAACLEPIQINEFVPDGSVTFRNGTVAVINAGNIPFAGLHDLLCVLVQGYHYQGKNASEDRILLPFIVSLIEEVAPELITRISFVEKVSQFDMVIANGSNNTSRYFESYFSKVPHIIRKHRNAVAVISGKESAESLKSLGGDLFDYFGLGCRNVSKLYVPQGYNFNLFFESIYDHHATLMNHHKYMNNFDYNNAVLMMKKIDFLQNGFLIVLENVAIASPISILHFEYYHDLEKIQQTINDCASQIQCVATDLSLKLEIPICKLGQAQQPTLNVFADNQNTNLFLLNSGVS
jgi:hypothetical protein